MIEAKHGMTSALRALLQNQPLSKGKVSLAWSVAVGRRINQVTSVSLTADGTLQVSADDRHWAREVVRSSGLITSRVNQLLGDNIVKRIDVRTCAQY
jgi:predicted nucleic acid-binding Zn ribbon protein